MSTSKSIAWHRECLKNQESSLARQREYIAKLQMDADRNAQSIVNLRIQIESAIQEGKDGFDGDRYMKKKLVGVSS